MIKQYVQDLRLEFKDYDHKKLTNDIMAGLTVTAVALPLALAFGVSSGADAASGLITAIIAGLLIGGLSGASYQISGPTGAMSAILMSLAMKHGMEGVFLAGFISGIILLIAAAFRFGRLVSFIPAPVITGFTSGIAVIIALGQVDNFLGTTSQGENAIEKIMSYAELGFSTNLYAILFGLLVVFVMVIWPKKWNAKFPSSLAGIIIALAINWIFELPVDVVGEIPKTLFSENRLTFGVMSVSNIINMINPAISIAMLGMIESLLCGASAGKMKNEPLNADRELVAQGIGNVLIPFFGGVPATAAIARTSVAIKSGAQTRLVSVIHSVGLIASMFLLGSVMSKIPLSALAGVLMVTAWRMNEWHEIKYIFNKKFGTAILEFTITMAATVMFDLTIAILIGVFSGIMMFVMKNSDLKIDVSTVDLKRIKGHDVAEDFDNTKIVYLTGPLFFITREKLTQLVEHSVDAENMIISMRAVTSIDESAVIEFKDVVNKISKIGTKLIFCGVQCDVKEMFDRSGLTDLIGEDCFFWDAIGALRFLNVIQTENDELAI
ncbi:MAG: SulP family inorganic anion transporter [Sedimentibacter sp.]|uniref:SulP family inorganic anion transporter n=1 Tax=Sedimentibacter sp. TaxID=1960295 RepID=UPI00298116E6|nr:SulP family inorganic anion transporter [Sedimentibacter sp.]MDW5299975.1 SulP family inorganic anion transporter [Sedimentibacter sp.]